MANAAFGANTPAGKILTHLRYGPRTVEELAKTLHLTDNAIRNQLRKLVDARMVARIGRRPGTSKPSIVYGMTAEGQIVFSRLYLPVLSHFLRVAETGCSSKQLKTMLGETGRALAAGYPKPRGTLAKRADAAARLLNTLGGVVEVHRERGRLRVRSRSCPLSALTRENSAVCAVIQSLVAEYVGAPVEICCTYEEEPRCCLEVVA